MTDNLIEPGAAPDPEETHRRARRVRYHRRWVSAGFFSAVGDGMFRIGLPLLAISTTKSPTLITLITVASYVPEFAAPLFGPMIDRARTRNLIIAVDATRGLLALGLGVAVLTSGPEYWYFLATSFLFGIAEVIYEPADEAFVVEMADDTDDIIRLNSRGVAAVKIGDQFVGRPIGGALLGLSQSAPIFADGISYLLSAAMLSQIDDSAFETDFDDDEDEEEEEEFSLSYRAEIVRGFRQLVGDRDILRLAATTGSANFSQAIPAGITVLYFTQVVGITATGFGALSAIGGCGVLLGSRIAPGAARRLGLTTMIAVTLGLLATTTVAVAFAPNIFVLAPLVAFEGMLGAGYNVAVTSANQTLVSTKFFGAVRSSYRLLAVGTVPFGAAAGAVIAELFGLRGPFLVSAAVLALLVLLPVALKRASEATAAES